MTIYQVYDFAKKHGVVTPIFDAAIRSGLRSMGIDDTADPYAYYHTPRGEYELRSMIYSTPFVGDMLKHHESMGEMDRTLDRYGLTYDDVLKGNIRKTIGVTGSGFASSGFNFVSSNLEMLYK